MDHRSIPSRSERVAVLTATVVMHLSLFALLFSIGSASPIPPARPGSLSLISLTPEVAQGKPPPPALPSKVADPMRILSQVSFSAELDPTALGAASGCGTFDLVVQSLTAEPTVAAALLSTPPESRSIADAVVIWNARWSDTASSPDFPLGPARNVIEQSLRSIPDMCLDEPVAGPRLVPIPEGERTMFLAIGSGDWTWRQLLTEPDAAPQPGMSQVDAATSSLWDWF